MRRFIFLMLILLAGTVAFGEEAPAFEALPASATLVLQCQVDDAVLDDVELEAAKGKPPKGDACCNPDDEPGTNGNPFCFEGHTCCSDGVWRCNNPDATPSCEAGDVCDASCGGRGDSCSTGADCCSGVCGKNGRCR